MSIRDDARDAGYTLAELGEAMDAPKPRSWADVEDRADEAVAALTQLTAPPYTDTPEPDPYVAPAPVGELTDHKQPGRRVTAWFVRQ